MISVEVCDYALAFDSEVNQKLVVDIEAELGRKSHEWECIERCRLDVRKCQMCHVQAGIAKWTGVAVRAGDVALLAH